MGVLVGVEGAQVGEALPVVPRHLGQEGLLEVHHLVVGEGQEVLLVEGVPDGPGEALVAGAAVHRVGLEVLQGVVHPAHVPLEVEPQAGPLGLPGRWVTQV